MENVRGILKELATLFVAGAIACIGYALMQLADMALHIGSLGGFALTATVGIGGYLIYRVGAWMWSK